MGNEIDGATAIEKIDGRPVVLSVSGGKDSTAAGLLLMEWGIPFTAVHCDTGWEHPQTEEYLSDVLNPLFGGVDRIGYPGGMRALIESRRGLFPTRLARFCTQELKVQPMAIWLRDLDEEPVIVVGIRREESHKRSTYPMWERSEAFDCEVFRPLVDWTLDDVIAIHHRHQVSPNPLYTRNHARVGCWPCINGSKAEIRRMADDPIVPLRSRLKPLEDYSEAQWDAQETEWIAVAERVKSEGGTEEDAARAMGKSGRLDKGKVRVAKAVFAGEPLPPRNKKAWFHSSSRGPMPVDDAIAWARSSRSNQVELFKAPDSDQGCMRWGLCDTGARSMEEDR